MKFAIQTIFQFSSVKYVHIAVPQICRTFSSCLLRCLFCILVHLLFALLLVPFTQKAPTEACCAGNRLLWPDCSLSKTAAPAIQRVTAVVLWSLQAP